MLERFLRLASNEATASREVTATPLPFWQCPEKVTGVPDDDTPTPFFLVVTDHDRGVFAVEGPMTDDRPWQSAARTARDYHRRITCGPAGPDRDALAAEYVSQHKLSGVPPGSIMRPRG